MLKDLSFKQLNDLYKSISQEEALRFVEVLKGEYSNRAPSLKETLSGINWDNPVIWQKFNEVDANSISIKSYESFLNEEVTGAVILPPLYNSLPHRFREAYRTMHPKLGRSDLDNVSCDKLIKAFLRDKIFKKLSYDIPSEELFANAPSLIGEDWFRNTIANLMGRLASMDISQGFEWFHRHIKENNLMDKWFFAVEHEANVAHFVNDTDYKKFFVKVLQEGECFMKSAMSDGNLPKIKLLHEAGVGFPMEGKATYSDLFMKGKDEAMRAQEYVINHVPDICVGGQVILKTLLHHTDSMEVQGGLSQMELVKKTLARYTPEQALLLGEALKKREPSQAVSYVQRYLDHIALRMRLGAEGSEETKVKKPKL